LELLEELLQDYTGTVFLVSHDRAFLDNVVTDVIAAEPVVGQWREYVGGFYDWQRQSGLSVPVGVESLNLAPKQALETKQIEVEKTTPVPSKPTSSKTKLSYKEQRELEALPALMEQLEAEQKRIEAQLADGSIFTTQPDLGVQLTTRLAEIEDELLTALTRWEELDARL
jgi:ATP-binding cassette subfamily F protein uup